MRRVVGWILDPPVDPSRVGLLGDVVEVGSEVLHGARLVGFEILIVTDRCTEGARIYRMTSFAAHRLEQALALFDHSGVRERAVYLCRCWMSLGPLIAILLRAAHDVGRNLGRLVRAEHKVRHP